MRRLLGTAYPGVILLGVLSAIVAALQFVVPLYMMAVYNRILQTKSIETLQLISLIAVALLIVLGLTEIARSRILALIGSRIASYLNEDVYQAILTAPGSALAKAIDAAPDRPRTEALQDLRIVSQFVSSGALNVFFDAIFAPIFLVALFVLHPLIGWIGVAAALFIFALAFASEILARRATKDIVKSEGEASAMLENSLSQHDAVAAMGLGGGLYDRWQSSRSDGIQKTTRSQTWIGILSGLAKATRLVVQMGVLGVGAYLAVTTNSFLAGAIIAASIILGRALAPIDQSIGMWRPFVAARDSAARLVVVMDAVDAQATPLDVAKPNAQLYVDRISVGYAGQPTPLVTGMSMDLKPGDSLGIFGPNGAGKTSVLKALIGILPPLRGNAVLGNVPLTGFSDSDRRLWFGYLPQDVQLLPGTVGENIARFMDPDKNALFDAVETAGADPVLQSLPLGFSTPIGPGALSSGQTQSVGLARAVYGAPLVLAMDEPTANLDAQSRAKVLALIQSRSDAGLITIFTSHDDGLLKSASHLMQMAPGGRKGIARLAERDKILAAIKAEAEGATPK
ncbi:MAG: ATP-binding cassette domain-containing protein [Pseudomonadota bacterium]